MPPAIPTPPDRFDEDCREAVHQIRGSLLNLYNAVGADPARPQDVSRRFKLGKNLAWKVARIIGAEDALAAVPLIPGAGGLEILLSAMEQAGAEGKTVERVREASRAFDDMIEIHVGDRAMLEIVLDSMGSSEEKPLAVSRKLAYRGNSGIWGIQAEVRVTAQFIAPSSEDAGLLDVALVAGFIGLRRLRSLPGWPLFRLDSYNDDQSFRPLGERRLAIDPDAAEDPWLIGEFCTGTLPEISVRRNGRALIYEAGNGPVGRSGEFDCFFGYIDRGDVPRFRDGTNTTAELVSSISMPVKTVLFDLLVHRDLPEAMHPRLELLGHPATGLLGSDSVAILPHAERLTALGQATMVKTPLVPDYDRLIGRVFERAGWNARDFVCLRLVMPYPPMPASVKLSYELPARG